WQGRAGLRRRDRAPLDRRTARRPAREAGDAALQLESFRAMPQKTPPDIVTVYRAAGEPTAILNNLRRCTRCAIPETQETIVFDEAGVCNVCRQHEYKRSQIDWTQRAAEFAALVDE